MAPAFAGAFIGLGQAEVQRGRVEEAAVAFRTAEQLLKSNRAQLGLQAPQLIWGYGSMGLPDDAGRLFSFLEQWSAEYEVGAGNWVLAHLGLGNYDEARKWLERAVANVEAHEPDPGFYNLVTIKANPFNDPVLEESPFRELRQRLGGFD